MKRRVRVSCHDENVTSRKIDAEDSGAGGCTDTERARVGMIVRIIAKVRRYSAGEKL